MMNNMLSVIISLETTPAHINQDTLEMEQFALVRTSVSFLSNLHYTWNAFCIFLYTYALYL